MKIKEFVEGIKNGKISVEDHVLDRYVPIEEKQARAEMIVENAYYSVRDDGTREFRANSVALYMMMCMTLLDLYTDIEREGNILEDFNALNEVGVFKFICQNVSKREIDEFKNVLDWQEKDLIKNEYEIGGYMQRQVERFALILGNVLGPVLDNFDVEKVKNILEEVRK